MLNFTPLQNLKQSPCSSYLPWIRRSVQTESIASLQNVRLTRWPKDLSIGSPPLRLIDAINPVFDLHDYTSVLWDRAREVWVIEEPLRSLECDAAVLAAAGVDLECLLVGVDVKLDSGPGGAEAGDRGADVPIKRLLAVG